MTPLGRSGLGAWWRHLLGACLIVGFLLVPAGLGADHASSEGESGSGDAQTEEVEEAEGAEESEGAEEVVFLHPLDDEPLDLERPEGDERTEATERFHDTGENLYTEEDAEEARAEGAELFAQWCASCHGQQAGGGMGPSLVDERYRYDRTDTDIGMFEVIHSGATGAMQAFGTRLSQDEILRIIAYVRSLEP